MKVLKESLYWEALCISTPKYLKEFNNKTILQRKNEIIDKFNNIDIGDVLYTTYFDYDCKLNQKEIMLILNGDIQLFSKRIVLDKKIKIFPYSFNEYNSCTNIETIDENGKIRFYNVNILYTKEEIKTKLKSFLHSLRDYYSNKLSQYYKIKYTNREKIIQGLDNLINNLDKLFI